MNAIAEARCEQSAVDTINCLASCLASIQIDYMHTSGVGTMGTWGYQPIDNDNSSRAHVD